MSTQPQPEGLHEFFVKRVDGRDEHGRDREGAEYFVLDLTYDSPHSLRALEAYIDSLRETGHRLGLADELEEHYLR